MTGLPEKILRLHTALSNGGLPHAFGGALACSRFTSAPTTPG